MPEYPSSGLIFSAGFRTVVSRSLSLYSVVSSLYCTWTTGVGLVTDALSI